GVQAAKKAIETLLAEDLEDKVLVLPDGADPDEFIRLRGAGEYPRHRGDAQHHIQFVIDQAVRDSNLHRVAGKAEAVEEVLPYDRAVRSQLQKREYYDIAMDALRITDQALKRELWRSTRSVTDSTSASQKVLGRSATKPTVAEERLLELMFADDDIRQAVLPRLSHEDFWELPTARIFQALLEVERASETIDFENMSRRLEGDAVATAMLPMLLIGDSSASGSEERSVRVTVAERCLETLRLMRVDRRIDELKSEQAAAERNGDRDDLERLVIEQIELARQRGALLPQAELVQ